jgi:hypothetical protein
LRDTSAWQASVRACSLRTLTIPLDWLLVVATLPRPAVSSVAVGAAGAGSGCDGLGVRVVVVATLGDDGGCDATAVRRDVSAAAGADAAGIAARVGAAATRSLAIGAGDVCATGGVDGGRVGAGAEAGAAVFATAVDPSGSGIRRVDAPGIQYHAPDRSVGTS